MAIQVICSVLKAGPIVESDILYIPIQLKEKTTNYFAGQNLWFNADPSAQREMLATALAAMTSGLRVYVTLDDINPNVNSGDSSGNIQSIYLST
jgi:hypothetical protein